MKIDYLKVSDKGPYRNKNEDYLGIYPEEKIGNLYDEASLFIVADGVGGGQAGNIASEIAVKTCINLYSRDDLTDIVEIFYTINDTLKKYAKDNNLKSFGTTLTLLISMKNEYKYFHVGDSRLFLLRNKKLRQLTIDHKPYEDGHKSRNLISQALGISDHIDVDKGTGQIIRNDIFLLATDGLPKQIFNDYKILKELNRTWNHELLDNIISNSRQLGSKDNISLIIIKYRKKWFVYLVLITIIVIIGGATIVLLL